MSIECVAIDERPMVVIDNIYRTPQAVREFALAQQYGPAGGLYPGRFSRICTSFAPLLALINDVLRVPNRGPLVPNKYYGDAIVFAVVTTSGCDLVTLQQHPHSDGFCEYAGVLYLSGETDCCGGTAFWRHRQTGLAYVPADGDQRSEEAVGRLKCASSGELLRNMTEEIQTTPGSGYLTSSNAMWELLALVRMQPNRLVVYDANLFHSIHLGSSDWQLDQARPRLTQNLYLDHANARAPA